MESKIKKLLAVHTPGTAILPAWLRPRESRTTCRIATAVTVGWNRSPRVPSKDLAMTSLGKEGFTRPGSGQTSRPRRGDDSARHARARALRALGHPKVFLFSPPKTPLPAWFRNHDWQVSIRHFQTSILPESLGLTDHDEKTFSIRLSSPERAMLECLYLAPDELDLVECFQVMRAGKSTPEAGPATVAGLQIRQDEAALSLPGGASQSPMAFFRRNVETRPGKGRSESRQRRRLRRQVPLGRSASMAAL